MNEIYPIAICTDCILALANGSPYAEGAESPESEAREAALIAYETSLAKEGAHLACGSSELGFSWHACDGCGDRAGGDRHEAFEVHPSIGTLRESLRIAREDCHTKREAAWADAGARTVIEYLASTKAYAAILARLERRGFHAVG